MVGNAIDARIALDDYQSDNFAYRIGSGCSRSAHLVDGVVYKIGIYHGGYDNIHEYEQSNVIRPMLPRGFVIPDMTLFEIDGNYILACEFVSGIPTPTCRFFTNFKCECGERCIGPDLTIFLDHIGYDIWEENILVNEDTVYLVDCA